MKGGDLKDERVKRNLGAGEGYAIIHGDEFSCLE